MDVSVSDSVAAEEQDKMSCERTHAVSLLLYGQDVVVYGSVVCDTRH